MSKHNIIKRDALRDNIINHVYNNNIMDIIGLDSKLIAIAIAAHNNSINWNSTINDNDVIPQNELNNRINNLVRVIYRNVDPNYSRTSVEVIMKDRDAYE